MMSRKIGQRLHDVPTHIVFSRLATDLTEYSSGPWWACVALSDGTLCMRGQIDGMAPPPGDVVEKMVEITVMLNRELHLRGHWVSAWADNEIAVFWRDGDGDLQFTQTFAEPWVRIRDWPVTEFAQRAQAAWSQWYDFTTKGLSPSRSQRERMKLH